jgi:hypothetical protein
MALLKRFFLLLTPIAIAVGLSFFSSSLVYIPAYIFDSTNYYDFYQYTLITEVIIYVAVSLFLFIYSRKKQFNGKGFLFTGLLIGSVIALAINFLLLALSFMCSPYGGGC